MLEQFEDDPAYLVLYTYLYQTSMVVKNGNISSIVYQRLGNLPADMNMRYHIEGCMRVVANNGWNRYTLVTELPVTANYTFVHPQILFAKDIDVETKADYIKAVRNISLRRRLEGGKLIVPAGYVEDWVDHIPGITQSKTKDKIRFNLEEQIQVIKGI